MAPKKPELETAVIKMSAKVPFWCNIIIRTLRSDTIQSENEEIENYFWESRTKKHRFHGKMGVVECFARLVINAQAFTKFHP